MTRTLVLFALAGGSVAMAQPAATQPTVPDQAAWKFDQAAQWGKWTCNEQIQDIQFEPDCVSFRTTGSDPAIVGPLFDWPRAVNGQHVEIDIDCDAMGEGELYFTNTTAGANGGFQAKWYVPVVIPGAGREVVPIWPSWETLGKVVRLRFDPPSGVKCRLYGIRVVQDRQTPAQPSWTFGPDATSWQAMYAARLEPTGAGLRVKARRPMALLATAVEPFAAAERSILRMSLNCPGEHSVCLYWATRDETGLWGEPIELSGEDDRPMTLDLRQFRAWNGTITNLAIGFGSRGGEELTLRSLSIEECNTTRPFVRTCYLGYASGVGRPQRPTKVRAILEHAAGLPLPAGHAVLQTDGNASCDEPRRPVPALGVGERAELSWTIVPRAAGAARVSIFVNGQTFVRTLRVDPPVPEIAAGEYAVPEPQPVAADYRVGVYYYPGWSDPKMGTWKKQTELPERDPLLGWYREGLPEVADWHVKWALENGISFFVYDWYWRDGKEELGAALNDGLLKSRYGDRIKFAVMWANHRPFSAHTPAQLMTVTDYWIERYLRRPNYLTVEGKPYVSIYCPKEMIDCLGSVEKVRESLDAMRERVKAAGLAGLHVAAIDIPGQLNPAILKTCGFDSFTSYTYPRIGTTVAHSLYRPYLLAYRGKWEQAGKGRELPYVPAMAIGWDGPVWYGPRSERRRGRRTEDWAEGLARMKAFLDETGGRMAILEAWNEWGEGAYLEPNVEFGFADLEAVRSTFASPGAWPINIGPDDVGAGGKYDQRRRPAASQSAPAR